MTDINPGMTDPNPAPAVQGASTPQTPTDPNTPPTIDNVLGEGSEASFTPPQQVQPQAQPQAQTPVQPQQVQGAQKPAPTIDSVLGEGSEANFDPSKIGSPAPSSPTIDKVKDFFTRNIPQYTQKFESDIKDAYGTFTQDMKDPGLSPVSKAFYDKLFGTVKPGVYNPVASFNQEFIEPALGALAEANTFFGAVVDATGTQPLVDTLPLLDHIPHMDFSEEFNRAVAEKGVPNAETMTETQLAARDQFIGQLPKTGLNAPDIHAAAFGEAPEAFSEYNTLLNHQDVIRAGIKGAQEDLLKTPEALETQGKIKDILDSVNGDESELSDRKADQLSEARDALHEAQHLPTPEIQDLQDTLKKINDRIDELTPDIQSAYRSAHEKLTGAPPEPAEPVSTGPAPSDAKPGEIAQEVSKRLQDAGRPKDEAEVAGQLIEAHYNSRAARLEGKAGSAKVLFDKEFPDIKGPGSEQLKGDAGTLFQSYKTDRPLVVARKMPDGSIKYGQPGDMHSALYTDEDFDTGLAGDYSKDTGFAEGEGHPFLTREQAKSLVQERLGVKHEDFKYGNYLEAHDYNNILKDVAGKDEAKKGFVNKILDIFRQEKRGSLTLKASGKNIMRLFKTADASTFFHETGHQWLEELMRDARHSAAPAELIKDAKTIRDFLGGKAGEGITRAQHERFARTFERYLREGIAPSKDLAGVFAKLKQWLVSIYKKVSDLKAPINGEIRGVFDRLISTPEDRTVIAPEDKGAYSQSPVDELFQKKRASSGDTPETPKEGGSKTVWPEGHSPNDLPTRPGAKYITTKGDYNLDAVSSHNSLIDAVREFANSHQAELAPRKGNLTNQDIIDFNESMGVSANRDSLKAIKQLSAENNIPLPVMVYSAGRMMVQASKNLEEMFRTGADELVYVIERQKLLKIAETFQLASSDWAITGHALRMLAKEAEKTEGLTNFLQKNIGKSLYQIQQELKDGKQLDSPRKIAGAVQKWAQPTWNNLALEVYHNYLISGPITHAAYTAGNYLYTIYKTLPKALLEAGIGKLQDFKGNGPEERVHIGEVRDGTYALLSGTFDGFKAFKDAMVDGTTKSLRVQDLAEAKAKYEGLTGKALEDRISFLTKNPTDAMLLKSEGPQKIFSNTAVIPGKLGSVIRWPGERMVGPLHSMTYTLNYLVNEARLISRQAHYESELSGDTSKVSATIAKLKADTPIEIVQKAKEEAMKSSLMAKIGPNTGLLQGALNIGWDPGISLAGREVGKLTPFKFVQPFINIALQIKKLALVDEGPLGVLSKDFRENVSGKNGNTAQARVIAGPALGTAFLGSMVGLYYNKQVTGPPPADRNQAIVKQMIEGLPYSVRIGEMGYEYNKLGVVGDIMTNGADLAEFMHEAENTGWQSAAGDFVMNFGKQFLQEGPISGISDLFNAVEGPGRYGKNYLDRMGMTLFEPYSVGMGQIAKRIDPNQRVTHGFLDDIKANTPYLSFLLEPKVDIFGSPVPNNNTDIGIYASKITNDPVWQALQGAHYFPAPVKTDIQGVKLTDEQYFQYATMAGTLAKQLLDQVVADPGFKSMKSIDRHDIMKTMVEQARSHAELAVRADPKNANISEQITKNKINLRTQE